MQIMIDIDKDAYNILKNYTGHLTYSEYLIKNGKPLPKGHGRLIDADELTESTLCKTFGLRSVDIENAPTIIEADRGDEE